jgi:hypothetical protein
LVLISRSEYTSLGIFPSRYIFIANGNQSLFHENIGNKKRDLLQKINEKVAQSQNQCSTNNIMEWLKERVSIGGQVIQNGGK